MFFKLPFMFLLLIRLFLYINDYTITNNKENRCDSSSFIHNKEHIDNYTKIGLASYYNPNLHGRRTASGEQYHNDSLTAAHRTLPLGSYVLVKKINSNDSIVLRINDRGPYSNKRIIDVSYAAAKRLNMVKSGISKVEVKSISYPFK